MTETSPEASAAQSLAEAARYRGIALNWANHDAFGAAHTGAVAEHYRTTVRCALGYELKAELTLGRLTVEQYLLGQRLLTTWHGDALPDLLTAIRSVSA